MTRPSGSACLSAMTADRHAVIVGGSLVGKCAALALSRDGWRVTLLERFAELTGGTGISVDRRRLALVTGIDADALPVVDVGFAATAWELLSALLSAELRQRPGVCVRTGERVLAVKPGSEPGSPSVVATTDGELAAGLVVGADGHASTVRRFVAPKHPHASYAGYVLWRGLIDERRVEGGFTGREIRFTEHEMVPARLVTFGVPGGDGGTRPGQRRASFTWFDSGRTELLRQSGLLDGEIVTGSLTGGDVPADIVAELRGEAQRWPSPWSAAIDRSLAQGDFIATPVAEYLPTHLIRGSSALIGDAAHVVSPVTGAGFRNGLLDVHALSTALRRTPRERIDQALARYQQLRLPRARRLVTQSRRWSSWYALSAR